MILYVIDTSVLVKTVIPEDYSLAAINIVSLHQASGIRLIAPDYVLLECANVLWKHSLRNNLPTANMVSALRVLHGHGISLIPHSELLEDALNFAIRVGIAIYDALFCVLAQRERAELITADLRLVNDLAGTGTQTLTLEAWEHRF